jgi:hypothetical protein
MRAQIRGSTISSNNGHGRRAAPCAPQEEEGQRRALRSQAVSDKPTACCAQVLTAPQDEGLATQGTSPLAWLGAHCFRRVPLGSLRWPGADDRAAGTWGLGSGNKYWQSFWKCDTISVSHCTHTYIRGKDIRPSPDPSISLLRGILIWPEIFFRPEVFLSVGPTRTLPLVETESS